MAGAEGATGDRAGPVKGPGEDLGSTPSAHAGRAALSAPQLPLAAAAERADAGKGNVGGGGGAEGIVRVQAGGDGDWGHRREEMWTDLGPILNGSNPDVFRLSP